MSNPPWTIPSTKRKAKSRSATPASRKRSRSSLEGAANSSRRKSQQTLTQAQWVTHAPSSEEVQMQLLEEREPHSELAMQKPRRTLTKRESTLTQMDFFNHPQDFQTYDDAMLEPDQAPLRNTALPQFDGPSDSPRKRRKSKATPATNASSRSRRHAPESQEDYMPTTSKRKSETVELETTGSAKKRKSDRLATKSTVFSDPAQNLDYFTEALSVPRADDRQGVAADTTFGYPLEIKDSTEDNDDLLPQARPTSRSPVLPQTPKRPAAIVLSSQSPESLPPSSRRMRTRLFQTPSKSHRTPLAQRSINLPTNTVIHTAEKGSRTSKRRAPRSKVVVLKLPKRQPRRPTRIEDSQNLWSLPSSSPKPGKKSPQDLLPTATTAIPIAEEGLEIPATSQAQANLECPAVSQESLQIFGDLSPGRSHVETDAGDKIVDMDEDTGRLQTLPEEAAIIVRDFGAVTPEGSGRGLSREKQSIPSSPPAIPSGELAKHLPQVDIDDLDFGSPIANDTQFNMEVQNRVSSPLRQGRPPSSIHHSRPSTPSHFSGLKDGVDLECADVERIMSSQSPLPVPQLVSRTEAEPVGTTDADDEVILPQPIFVHPATIRRTTSTQVPLNDTFEGSSSPRTRHGRSHTQKSAHPASLPHPSQISTQEPTQAYLPPSSMPQNNLDELAEKEEIVTLKTSSCSNVPLCQIPRHIRSSQAGPDPAAVLDDMEWEDDEDFDLDPFSMPAAGESPLPQASTLQERLVQARSRQDGYMPTTESPARNATSSTRAKTVHEGHNEVQYGPDQSSVPTQSLASCRPGVTPVQGRLAQVLAVPGQTANSNSTSPRSARQITSKVNEDSVAHELPQVVEPTTPDHPPPPKKKWSPIPGFNNETQSNFTQNGHVTAAYIHRQHDEGLYPKWFIPKPYQVPGYTRL